MRIPALLLDSCPKRDGLLVDQLKHPASFGLLLLQMSCTMIGKQKSVVHSEEMTKAYQAIHPSNQTSGQTAQNHTP